MKIPYLTEFDQTPRFWYSRVARVAWIDFSSRTIELRPSERWENLLSLSLRSFSFYPFSLVYFPPLFLFFIPPNSLLSTFFAPIITSLFHFLLTSTFSFSFNFYFLPFSLFSSFLISFLIPSLSLLISFYPY